MSIDKQILEFINLIGSSSVKDICARFFISESTARRSLVRLEANREIVRFKGGAHSLSKEERSQELQERFNQYKQEKEIIAEHASNIIKPGSVVIMLGGTTVFKMCKYIKNKQLTVITNSVLVFNSLKNYQNIQMILLGGSYNQKEEELTGVLTISTSKLLTADYLFMGANGYVRKVGFTTSDPSSIELYSWCISVAKEKYIVVDSSKFDNRGNAIFANINSISGVITNSVPEDVLNELKNKNVEVIK